MVRFVMVEVALLASIPPVRVWSAVQVLALVRLREATTAPVVGEMVRVPSELVTEVTVAPDPEMQAPFTAKQPLAMFNPFPKVEVAVVEVMLRRFAANPPVNVEVEVIAPDTLRKPCSVEVPVVLPWMVEVADPPM